MRKVMQMPKHEMKDKRPKEVLFALACMVGVAVLIHIFGSFSWNNAFGIACGMLFIWNLQQELQVVRDELRALRSSFIIADAELVRVSALATELEDKLSDLTIKHSELEGKVLCM